jgi:hypothetical protein
MKEGPSVPFRDLVNIAGNVGIQIVVLGLLIAGGCTA